MMNNEITKEKYCPVTMISGSLAATVTKMKNKHFSASIFDNIKGAPRQFTLWYRTNKKTNHILILHTKNFS